MHYLFARTNNETNIQGLYFLSTRRYLGQLFKSYGNPVKSLMSMNINIRNKISFFEDPQKMIFYFLNIFFDDDVWMIKRQELNKQVQIFRTEIQKLADARTAHPQ